MSVLRPLLKILLVLIGIFVAAFVVVAFLIFQYSQESSPLSADAAIVLGAAPWGDEPSPVFRERINHAVTLYQQRRVRKIIMTGGPLDAEVARAYALEQGGPARDVLWETTSRTTEQDLFYANAVAQQQGLATFLVVSDPLHMKRAMLMANDLGLNAYSSPTPTTMYQSWNTQGEFLLRESFYYLWYLMSRSSTHFP
jgi:uncharacterized SAM-binding protein YcdF (DUF218 family)